MGKQVINSMIAKMKKAGMVTQITPWLHEQGFEVRYVGCKPLGWEEIFSNSNNVLCKFLVGDNDLVEIFIANKPPFISLGKNTITKQSKWELILGEMKRQLHKDKVAYIKGDAKLGNLYQKIVAQLKK